MAKSQFLEYQDKDNSGLLDACDELTNVPEQKICPPCDKNINYIAPDWKTKDVDEPWLNEKTCQYQITIVTQESSLIPVVGADDDEANEHVQSIFDEHKNEAIDGILVYFEKDNSESNVLSLSDIVEYEKYDLDIRRGSRVKLLYSVPYENIALISAAIDDESDEDEEESTPAGNITVTYNAAELNSNVLKVRRALNMYGTYLNVFRATQRSNVIFEGENRVFNLKRYGDNGITGTGTLEKVIKAIDGFLSKKNYILRGGKFSGIGLNKDIVNEIGFTFSDEYKLKKITITTRDCGDKETTFGPKKIKSLTKKGVFKDKTAMGYLSKIDDMITQLTAREPPVWTDFIVEHTYPTVIVLENWPFGTDSSLVTAASCVGDTLVSEAKQLGQDILDVDFDLADAVFYNFNKIICKSDLEEVERESTKLGLRYEPEENNLSTILALAKVQANKQFELDDGVFGDLCAKVLGMGDEKDATPSDIKGTLTDLLGTLKLCGLKDVLIESTNCLLGGLSFEVSLGAILKSALQNMSIINFGKMVNLLPPEDQGAVKSLVRAKLESGNIFDDSSTNQRINDYIKNGVDPGSITNIEPWDDREFLQQVKEAGQNSLNSLKSTTSQLSGIQNNNNVKTLAQRFGQKQNSPQQAYGLIMEIYIEAIITHFSEDLFSVLEVLNRFPGSQLIAKLILLGDCPQPPLFSPSVLDFVRDIELPFCKGIDDITLPIIRNPLSWIPAKNDITGIMFAQVTLKLQNIFVSVLARLMVKVCNLIGNSLCQTLKSAGQILGSWGDLNDRTAIADIIRESICGPNANQAQVESTIIDMFEKLGLGAAALADTEKLLQFTGDMSASLTRGEMMNMFLGTPTSESLTIMDQIIEYEYPEYRDALPDEGSIADFTTNMGNLLPADSRTAMQNFLNNLGDEDTFPADPSICATPEALENFCDYRNQLLEGRATESQAKQMCDSQQADLLEKLEDITNALQQDPSELIANSMPPILSDPGCQNGLVPFEPEVVTAAKNKSLGMTLKQVFMDFSTDMLGNGPGEKNWGILNMILCDTLGTPLTAHYRKAFNRKNYVDFVTSEGADDQEGQFPLYIAEWMRYQMQGLDTTFNTNNEFADKKTITKTFQELGLSLYGGVDVLTLPDFGYETNAVVRYENETVDYIREGRKATPDIELQFRDNNKGKVFWEDSTYLYGFNMKLFLSEMREAKTPEGQLAINNIPADTVRINITNLLNFGADITRADRKSMTRDEKKAARSLRTPSIQKEREFEFLAVDDTFSLLSLDDYPDFQKSFHRKSDYIPQLVLLHEMLTQQGYTGALEDLKSFYNDTLDIVFAKIVEEIADNENAFLYGAKYDDLTEEAGDYVVQGGQTDSPGGTLYSDATLNGESLTNDDAVLGISRNQYEATNTEDIRVFYLDPAQFGGNYVNPPVYIKPLQNEGWLGLIDIMFPELSPCKPSKTDLIDFGEISEQIEETYNNIPADERLKFDSDCAVELPYNRILERYSAAGIQGVITAACRIYASIHFIKTMAAFTIFKPDFDNVYSSIYPQYIVENIEAAFKDVQSAFWERFNPFKDEEFWYSFLEQAVQTYGRLVDEGKIVDPPNSVLNAINNINEMQARYSYPTKENWKNSQNLGSDLKKAAAAAIMGAALPIPGAGAAASIKVFADNFETYKQYKERLNFEAIKATEDEAKIVLKEMVKTELQYMADKFIENLEAINIVPKYTDIDYFILTQFTNGGIDLDLDKEIVAVMEEEPSGPSYGTTSNVANHTHAYEVDVEGNGWAYTAYSPTDSRIKHKHQVINWAVQTSQSDCYPDCKDIYGNDGVGPHIHNISRMIIPIGDVESYNYEPAYEQISTSAQVAIDIAKEAINIAEVAVAASPLDATLQTALDTAIAAFEQVLATFGIDIEELFSSQKPFVIEKYININGIKYGIEEGSEIIKSNSPTLNISDVYPGTLEVVYALGDISQEASKSAATREEPTDEPVGIKGELGVRHGLQFSALVDGQKFEITSVEIDALDYEIQAFVPVQANSKELLCLLKMLKEDEKFKLAARYIVPTSKLLSLAAIYNDMAFLPSIGEVTVETGEYVNDDAATFEAKPGMKITFTDGIPDYSSSKEGWASADDRSPGFLQGLGVLEWDNWDQELLRNSKARIKSLFRGFYNSRDFESNFESMFDFDPVEFTISELKGRIRPNLAKAILPRWRRKQTRTNPFDSSGELCKK